jgi:hypothetical protein
MRFLALTGGESYFTGASLEAGRIRSRSAGVVLRAPIGVDWTVEPGAFLRVPERGEDDVTLHVGVRRRFRAGSHRTRPKSSHRSRRGAGSPKSPSCRRADGDRHQRSGDDSIGNGSSSSPTDGGQENARHGTPPGR